MKYLFKNSKRENSDQQGLIARFSGSFYERTKTFTAQKLNKSTAGLSLRTWKVLLLMFVLFSSGFCISIVVRALGGKVQSQMVISKIKTLDNVADKSDLPASKLSVVEIEKLKAFRIYIEGLKNSPQGKVTYDSILTAHPGILDSLAVIEKNNYYQSK